MVSSFKITIQKKHRNRCVFAFSQPLKTQMGHFPGQFWVVVVVVVIVGVVVVVVAVVVVGSSSSSSR